MLECFDLVIDYQKNPICIDSKKPQFSWKLKSDKNEVFQTAYKIAVGDVWDSGKVESGESIHIEYSGADLKPKTRYDVKVTVWDNFGEEAVCEGYFETAFLGENLWDAHWISRKLTKSEAHIFSKKFEVEGKVEKARIYATAYGVYEIFINGKKVSDIFMAPGYTSYYKRLQYQVYEAEEYLIEGENIIEVVVAPGWGCGRFPTSYEPHHTKFKKSCLFQLEIDGDKKQTIISDDTWKCRQSKVVASEIYYGEEYDATADDTKEVEFEIDAYGCDNLIAQVSEPVRIIEEISPVEIIKTPKGEIVLDFGQNLVGSVCFKAFGNRGDKVEISHAEILDKDGNFYNDNYRSSKEGRLKYTLSGENDEYHARYTFFGFRYIRIDQYPGEVDLKNFKALVMHTDMKRIGYFESSHKLLNSLFENAVWGQKGNYLDFPTDCPQRDERLGWTGDTQVFCRTGAENYNTALFLKKWLGDVIADQTEDGGIPIIIPQPGNDIRTAAGWGDCATICPWEIYNLYGDKKALRAQYNSMKKWVMYIKEQGENPYLWNTGFQYGDWLAMDGLCYDRGGGTSTDFIASAYYAYSTDIVRRTANVLGEYEDEKYYGELYGKIIENINEEFFTKTGRVCDNTQTAYAMSLYFNLVKDKKRAVKTLVKLVEENKNRLSTGFLGTPYLCDALAENGEVKKAYDLLLGEEYPSWLYSVKMGATTIWEHWDGIRPDGSLWDVSMNSYNHYAYGAVCDFLYRKIGGITPIEAGYKKILIKPLLDERLTSAKTSIDTMYGVVKTDWKVENEKFKISVKIPANTTAKIVLPDGQEKEVGSGKYDFMISL